MKLGVRGRLFVISLALLTSLGLASGLYLEARLYSWFSSRLETELWRDAAVARDMAAATPQDIEHMDPLADRLSQTVGARITLIAPDGRVLGDSSLDASQIRTLENHRSRPEVAQALSQGSGVATRYSTTVRTTMLYAALRSIDQAKVIARASLPLAEIDAAVRTLRWVLLVAGAVALGAAVFMSGVASHLLTRTLRLLVKSVQQVARGERVSRLPEHASAELAGLAGSFNRLSDDLEHTVAQLARERDRRETILQSMDEAVLAVDGEQRVTSANRAATKLLGLPRDAVGRALIEMVRTPALHDLLGVPLGSSQTEFQLAGWPPRQVTAHVARLHEQEGHVIVLRDVTVMRRLETIRRDFVANVSHELRTPVSVIQANLETLLSGALADPPATRDFVEAMQRNATRLAALVADLLDLSRLEAGQYPLAPRAIELAPLVERIVAEHGPLAANRRIQIATEIPSDLSLLADGKALEQILENLVDNASKYAGAGGHVVVRARTQGTTVRIEVADDGPGIAAQHRERVFERFYRVDPGRSRELGGTGLGLSIVKHLVGGMNGQVGAEPNAPRGTVFWLVLPAA